MSTIPSRRLTKISFAKKICHLRINFNHSICNWKYVKLQKGKGRFAIFKLLSLKKSSSLKKLVILKKLALGVVCNRAHLLHAKNLKKHSKIKHFGGITNPFQPYMSKMQVVLRKYWILTL